MTKSTIKDAKIQSPSFKLNPMNPCVAGMDIGAGSVFVCIGFADGHQEVREFLTFTEDLKNMRQWLQENGIKSAAMESTGVYWIPVYDILAQGDIDVTLVNAYYLKTVPGRKTDVKDCQWIQQLHAYGLLRGSFRPDDEGVTLRGYVRQRSRLIELASQQIQLMHKALVQMNIQLSHVIRDITGVTGMKIIRAIVAGERDPLVLVKYRDVRCKKDEKQIAKALVGNYREEHLLALNHALEAYDFFHKQVLECEASIEQMLKEGEEVKQSGPTSQPVEGRGRKKQYNRSSYYFNAKEPLERVLGVDLTEIPGLDINGIIKIIAEIGKDMSKWPTAKHFASWLGLCPGNKISGGKVLSSRTKPTANRAAQALRLAANALYRSQTALGAFFRRMRSKLGAPKAITAGAHKLAKILYAMLRERKSFKEIGQDTYEQMHKERQLQALKKRAKDFGFQLIEATTA